MLLKSVGGDDVNFPAAAVAKFKVGQLKGRTKQTERLGNSHFKKYMREPPPPPSYQTFTTRNARTQTHRDERAPQTYTRAATEQKWLRAASNRSQINSHKVSRKHFSGQNPHCSCEAKGVSSSQTAQPVMAPQPHFLPPLAELNGWRHVIRASTNTRLIRRTNA